jgi:hypothetical protein
VRGGLVRAAEGVRGEATRQKEGGNRVEIGQKSRQIRGNGELPEGPSVKPLHGRWSPKR